LRTILVWIFFLTIPTPIEEKFSWIQLVGFVFLVLGTLIYNEVLVLPFWGFNLNTKEEKEKRGGKSHRSFIEPQRRKSSFVHK
jgi:hypothetical protein